MKEVDAPALRAPAGRQAQPLPGAPTALLPVRLVLRPQVAPLRYALAVRWEQELRGEVSRTVVRKQLELSAVPQGSHLLLTWVAEPPRLRQPDPLPQEELLLRLAGLYRQLEIATSPAGEFLALTNQPAVAQAWAAIKAELAQRYAGDEAAAFIAPLLADVEAQVQQPAALLASLRYDYAYHLLLPAVYQQEFASGYSYGQPKEFAQFLPEVDLHFDERLRLAEPAAPGQVRLLARGQLDEPRTDRAAAAQQVAAALALVPGALPAPAPDPAALTFTYQASYDFEAATGWPLAVAATVRCHSPAGYAKEYDLTIERL